MRLRSIPVLLAFFLVSRGIARADAPAGRFTAAGGVVTDHVTGLLWQQTFASTYPWASAVTTCDQLALGGKNTGWRLPHTKELASLVDYRRTPAIDPTAFPQPLSAPTLFWTMEYSGQSDRILIDFSSGHVQGANAANAERARCVHDP